MSGAARHPHARRGLAGKLEFLEFGKDPLGFVERLARDCPGAAHTSLLGIRHVYLWDPSAIGEVLLDRERVFTKDWAARSLAAVLGSGLFSSEGDFWRRQRALIAPALRRSHVATYVDIAARRTAVFVAGLHDGEVRDIKADMTRLAMEIVGEALFGAAMSEDVVPPVAAAIEHAMGAYEKLIYTWRRLVPVRWPQRVRRQLADASRALDDVVLDVISRKRSSDADRDDLLGRLLSASDDNGTPMSSKELRDEVVTLLLAGHETTAMALSFAIAFLCEHPDAMQRLRQEAVDILGDRLPEAEDLARLNYASLVFKETLRLRPPIWLFGREAKRDCVVGDWAIRAGEQVLICPWVMHHDANRFEAAGEFRPERWLDGLEERLPRYVFLPFGGGNRVCAGMHFAMMEGALIPAMLSRTVDIELVDPRELAINAAITLRPRKELRIRVRSCRNKS